MQPEKGKKYVVPRPRNVYNFVVALFVAVGSLCYGCKLMRTTNNSHCDLTSVPDASSISAALIGQQSWYDYMGLTEGTPYTNAILGAINGTYAAGGAFGCVFNMWSSEYFGRKRSIQIGCCISIVGAAIMTSATGVGMVCISIGRTISRDAENPLQALCSISTALLRLGHMLIILSFCFSSSLLVSLWASALASW